jgi:hypothetical protein
VVVTAGTLAAGPAGSSSEQAKNASSVATQRPAASDLATRFLLLTGNLMARLLR